MIRKWFFIGLFALFCCQCWAITPLPAEQAFNLQIKQIAPNTLIATWDIKSDYFLYQDKLKVNSNTPKTIQLGKLPYPTTPNCELRNKTELSIPILGLQAGSGQINVYYQGCSNQGFCYPPMATTINLQINQDLSIRLVSSQPINLINPEATELSAADQANYLVSNSSIIWIVLSFLGFGLLLAFSPCVLPMIPVLSSIIIGQKQPLSTRKAFLLSLTYVLSMSLTYAIMGAFVAVIGENLQIMLQNPMVITSFSLLFVALALSMFGLYDLRLPDSFEAKIAAISKRQHHGAYLGTIVMGCLATLLLSPCVTPPLVGALSYIANTGDSLIGGIALFSLGFGMGLPLLIIGASAGKYLPKAGKWMNGIKTLFGIILLAMAIYLLERVIPAYVSMTLWASLLIMTGLYLGALKFNTPAGWPRIWQGIGIISLIYGVLILVGASMGHSNIFKPLSSMPAQSSKHAQKINELAAIQARLNQAKQNNQPVMLEFYADWCVSCKAIERMLVSDPTLINALQDVVWIKVDVTENDPTDKQTMQHYEVIAPPTYIFFSRDGNSLTAHRLVGEASANQYLRAIEHSKS